MLFTFKRMVLVATWVLPYLTTAYYSTRVMTPPLVFVSVFVAPWGFGAFRKLYHAQHLLLPICGHLESYYYQHYYA